MRGRLELAARLPNGAAVYVDYAHTPDALERLLTALRPHTTGRLHVVFGAGGDRDRGKRPLMGAAAARLADVAIVTDDNPRSEDPAAIRAAVLAACPGGREIGDRAARDRRGAERPRVRRCAGGGGQGPRAGPDDRRHGDPVRRRGRGAPAGAPSFRVGHDRRCWTAHDLLEATGGAMATPFAATGVSIDTRTLQPGDLFVALHGETGDGHDFVADALAKGAAGAMVHRDVPDVGRLLLVDDTLAGAASPWRLCARALHRPPGRGHRQRRQDDDQGDAADHPDGIRRARMPPSRPTTTTGACR